MRTTKIEWTDRTWNPVTGCSKISSGCNNCYAEIMALRLQCMGNKKYANGFLVTMQEESLNEPIHWKKSSNIFVCSMGDIFHENVPFEFVDKVISIIKITPRHNYQILTKRAGRMAEYFTDREIPKNVWLGVTVDVASSKERINYLRKLNSTVNFLSCEPLLEDLGELDLHNIDWVIVGGESGMSARPMKEEWVLNIKAQTDTAKIPFFFKQWGTWGNDGVKRNKKVNGKLLKGNTYQAMPKANNYDTIK